MKEFTEHPSFGLLSFARTTNSKGQVLFGSSIKHENCIRMSIDQGIVERRNSVEHYFGRKNLIQVDMSLVQFSEAITTLNHGVGTPVTIRTYGKEQMENPPGNTVRESFVTELETQINNVTKDIDDLNVFSKRLEKERGTLSVTDRNALQQKISNVTRELKDNLPFILKQFNRQMERSVNEAKTEIASFISIQKKLSASTQPHKTKKSLTESKKILGIK